MTTPAWKIIAFRCPHCSNLLRLTPDLDPKPTPKPREIQPGDRVQWSGIGLIGPPSGETATVLIINRDTRCAVVSLDRLRASCMASERYYPLGSIELIPEATA